MEELYDEVPDNLHEVAFTALLSTQSAGFAKPLKSISKSDRRDAVLLTRYGQVNRVIVGWGG